MKLTSLVPALALALGLQFAGSAFAAQEFYLTVEGTKQGKFRGDSLKANHKDQITGVGFTFEAKSPRDIATGQASGKRQYSPILVTKPVSASSTQFFTALVNNEVLKNVQLDFVRTNPNGTEEVYYTIKLTNASLTEFRQGLDATPGLSSEMEQVGFTFQKIEISGAGMAPAGDDWNSPR